MASGHVNHTQRLNTVRVDTGGITDNSTPAFLGSGHAKTAWPFVQSGQLAYIDGLRAVAIIAVVAFHARIPGFDGGFVGVDVFFVISGFLITRQIVGQLLAGCFSVTEFYARRVLRIFPPLMLVTCATLAAAPLFPLVTPELHDLAGSAAATAAMFSNYYFTGSIDYFGTRPETIPLLHTWSLGVEEQYYLIAPALMGVTVALALRREWKPAKALLFVVTVGAIISYVSLAILTETIHRLAFYSIMSRSWQFALGGMLAIAVLNDLRLPAWVRSAAGVAGFFAIVTSVMLFNQQMRYPGFAAGCMPAFGALLLLVSGLHNEKPPFVKLLASWPAVAVGVLSYSWYLWHWPIIELARTIPVAEGSVWKDCGAAAVALLLSVPTYIFLERPLKALRQSGAARQFGNSIVGFGIAGSAAVALGALALVHSSALDRHLRPIELGSPSLPVAGCQPDSGLPHSKDFNSCLVGGNGTPRVVYWGDSHAGMLNPIADWSARSEHHTAVLFGNPGCPPLLGIEADYSDHSCLGGNDAVLSWIKARPDYSISGVVLSARWLFYNEKETPSGQTQLPHLFWRDGRSASYSEMLFGGLHDLISALPPQTRVLIVGPVPELEKDAALCLPRLQLNGQLPQYCGVDRAKVEMRRRDAVAVLRHVAGQFPEARMIDPMEVFCEPNRCMPSSPRGVLYSDTNHLTVLGAELLYRRFESSFRWVYD